MSTETSSRLAMLGMIEGNGHPYSWTAIVNGYDPAAMNGEVPVCGHPRLPRQATLEDVRIPGARVTHLWTDNPAEAPLVAGRA